MFWEIVTRGLVEIISVAFFITVNLFSEVIYFIIFPFTLSFTRKGMPWKICTRICTRKICKIWKYVLRWKGLIHVDIFWNIGSASKSSTKWEAYTAPFMLFSFTYYLGLHGAISIYWECKILPSKVIYSLRCSNNLLNFCEKKLKS